MTAEEFNNMRFNGDIAYPDALAEVLTDKITDLCSSGRLPEALDEEAAEALRADLSEGLYYLFTICENPYNHDYFRTLYKVLSDVLSNI